MTELITLGEKQYSLRYTVNAVCCLEEKFSVGLRGLLRTDISCVRALLWCGLLDGNEKITPEDAGRALDDELARGGSLPDVAEKCARALSDAGFFRAAERK